MTYEQCLELDTIDILTTINAIEPDLAAHLNSMLIYHSCMNIPGNITHELFSSVLFSTLKMKEKFSDMLINNYN